MSSIATKLHEILLSGFKGEFFEQKVYLNHLLSDLKYGFFTLLVCEVHVTLAKQDTKRGLNGHMSIRNLVRRVHI